MAEGDFRSPSSGTSVDDERRLVLSDIEGHYFDTRTGRYYRLSSPANMVEGVPTMQDLLYRHQRPSVNQGTAIRARRDWRDDLLRPVLRRRHPEHIENLPFARLLDLLPYGRVDEVTLDRACTENHWAHYGEQRRRRLDSRKTVEMGDFDYATHMEACYKGGTPAIFSVLKKQGLSSNHIGVVRVRPGSSERGPRELQISFSETTVDAICDGKTEAFTVRTITDGGQSHWQYSAYCAYAGIVPPLPEAGSKIARCLFDIEGRLTSTRYVFIENAVKSVAFGPSSSQVIIGTESSVMLFDYDRDRNLFLIPTGEPILAAASKENGNELFVAQGRRGIRVFDLREGHARYTYRLKAPSCCSMKLLCNERHIITSHLDGNLLMYDFRMRDAVDAYKEHVNTTNWSLPIALDDRKQTVASAGSDGIVRIWSVHTADMVARLRPPYRVREEFQLPRFVHSDTWYGNSGCPAVLSCWLDKMQLSEVALLPYTYNSDDED